MLGVGLLAGAVGGVLGFGASVLMMPFLVLAFGPRDAVPIMAVAAVLANATRIAVWWRDVDWRACAAYSAAGIPGAAAGAATLVTLPPRLVEGALGVFFIAMVPARRWLERRELRLRLVHLALAGAVIGFLTGVFASTGPINAPFFLAYGLVKGAYISTEAAGSLAVFLAKVGTFGALGYLPAEIAAKGLATGGSLMAGTFVAKRFVSGLTPGQFRRLIEALLLVAGASMLWTALR